MAQLDKERQERLEPKRYKEAMIKLTKLGYNPIPVDDKSFQIDFNNETVTYYPYSGWATGKSIKDGRGFKNLLSQLLEV